MKNLNASKFLLVGAGLTAFYFCGIELAFFCMTGAFIISEIEKKQK